jgi:hypothetical protein
MPKIRFFNAILHPLFNDLKALNCGLHITVDGKTVCDYGSVVMQSGDNLGISSYFGIQCKFSGRMLQVVCLVIR